MTSKGHIPKNGQIWRERRSGREIIILNDEYEDVFVQWHYRDEPASSWHYSDCMGFLWDGNEHTFVCDPQVS
jgi:hypothetical protein